jgi:hypothetical protein
MRAVDQWAAIEEGLPERWSEARLGFAPEGSVSDAAAILAPLGAGRIGDELRIHVTRAESGGERLRNVLGRLDEKRIWGALRLLSASADLPDAEPAEAAGGAGSLPEAWDGLVASLPPDWSSVLCELALDSSDYVPRAALLGAPLNPARVPDAIALRFRASGGRGYGVSKEMARRCFERMAGEGITGRLSVVIDVSEASSAVTQGPVWRVAGRSV